ncbi:uncharacterized protein CC84DRAFT_433448 [Paraphaeosphaeria sporulosa]|uniref:Uncharacterized protein n=1 Tax=Paraphaeosphaeria sporulosa TaxID=1460663 RepID=A0A177CQY4_9PLEO|nr:uncharacterized protein CC84DRAFT_433448 [Paraphaeosphaeria sporulosa]OAG09300.1 hypothetical protein CC84DRAFT_433448 [Paraphaeosphaeria sporulosa]
MAASECPAARPHALVVLVTVRRSFGGYAPFTGGMTQYPRRAHAAIEPSLSTAVVHLQISPVTSPSRPHVAWPTMVPFTSTEKNTRPGCPTGEGIGSVVAACLGWALCLRAALPNAAVPVTRRAGSKPMGNQNKVGEESKGERNDRMGQSTKKSGTCQESKQVSCVGAATAGTRVYGVP